MNTDMCKFESSQNDESRAQLADFLKPFSKPRAFIVGSIWVKMSISLAVSISLNTMLCEAMYLFSLKHQLTHLFHFCSYVVFKSLAGMQWASENLTNDTLYSNGDDDVLVNLTKLHDLIEEKKIHFTKTMTFPIICVYGGMLNDHPVRNPKSIKVLHI